MAIQNKIISFWKQVKLKSSDMFTQFRVGVGVKVPTHKLHVKDSTDPVKIEGLQNDATDPDKFLTIDSSDVVKYRTGAQVLTDIGGTPLTTEQVQDVVGAMFSSNTETRVTATYQDADGTIDLVVDDMTADTNTNIANTDLTATGDRTLNLDSNALSFSNVADLTINAQSTIINGQFAAIKSGADAPDFRIYEDSDHGTNYGKFTLGALGANRTYTLPNATGTVALTSNIPTGNSIIDWTGASAGTIHSTNIPTLNQNTTGSAATLTTARTIGGVSFNGSANIDLPGVNETGDQDTSGNAHTATTLATARNINGVSFNGSANITVTAAGSTLSNTVPVSKGGTGATSFADKAVIITQDSSTDTLAAVTMSTNGQLLIGGTDGPAVATLTQGSGLTITNANGGITIAVDGDIDTTGESGSVDNIGNLTGDVTSSNRATTIANDAVTYAKMQNVSATNVVLGRDSAGAGVVEEISAANLRTIINVEDGATADQTQADINGLAITTVGTIGTGVWQGTTIKTAYIGDDQITEDKLADTLLAEIDANTAKVTNVSTNLTYTTGSDRITIVSSDGTNVVIAEASGSIAGVMTVAHHDKLDSIADNATADQTNVTGSSGSCTGNAATVTNGVYTSGNQTIADTKTFSSTLTYSGASNHSLSLNNTSATGSPFISFNQNGSRKSFIQHNDTGDTIKIASEYGKISLQTGTGGAETAYLDIENDGVIRFGAVDADSVLTTDGNMTFRIDADNDETSQKFIFQNNASTEIASLNESGVLDLEGIVRPDITYVKILPSDFVPDDVGRPAMIDDTGSDRWLESHGTAKLFAYVDIPVGFKATHVDVYGSATSAVTVYEADVNSKTVTSKGTGNIGTQIDITDVNSDATNYILIELAQASGEEVYGGKLTIAKI